MAKSIFIVQTINGGVAVVKNVLAQPSVSPTTTALQNAIDAAVSAAGAGAELVSASELQGKPADLTITAAVSPDTDGTPKALYLVSYRAGSGSGGTTPAPSLVLSNPQTISSVPKSPGDQAIACAATASSPAVPNQASLVGKVDIDAT
jgi:hypothetical protein